MRKRLLALLMALVMVFSLNTTFLAAPGDSATVDNTQKEFEAKWITEEGKNTWWIEVENPTEYNAVEFRCQIYKDGVSYASETYNTWNDEYAMDTMEFSVYESIEESGEYYVVVKIYAEITDENGNWSYKELGTATTEKATYVAPDKKLSIPANIVFSKDGIVTFDVVEGADYYELGFSYYDAETGNGGLWGFSDAYSEDGKTVKYDFKKGWGINENYLYNEDFTVIVRAMSGDINTAQHSEFSEEVGGFSHRVEFGEATIVWDANNPSKITIKNVADGCFDAEYSISIYKDGRWIDGYGQGGVTTTDDMTFDISWAFETYGPGEYVAKASVWTYGEKNHRYEGEMTLNYNPTNKLAIPGNVTLTDDNKITFDLVEGADHYTIFYREENLGTGSVREFPWGYFYAQADDTKGEIDIKPFFDQLDKEAIAESGKDINIKFGVRAITSDIDKIATSDAAWITVLENRVSAEDAEKNLDEALKYVETNPTKAQSVLANTSNDTLVELMKDAEFVEKVAKAEEAYVKEMNITKLDPKSDVAAIEASKVKVVGAGLNAGKNDTVQLTIAEPKEKATVPEGYKNGLQLDISLLVDGEALTDLTVPVQITMPIPEGVEKENLVILHYHGDATEPVVITPVVNEDGTMTFTVSGFSTFVIANLVAESPKTADNSVAVVCAMMLVAAAAVVVFKKRAAR